MFVTVQLPVVDVRPLVDGSAYRDPRPNWPVEQLRTMVAEMSATLPPEDAVAAEDATAGLSREADLAEEERRRPGILARLSSLADVAPRAGGAGTAPAAAVTAVRTAFGL